MLIKKGKPLWQITIWISVNVNSRSLPNFDTSVQSYSQMTFCECVINFNWWLCTFIVLMSLKLYLSSPKTIILIYIAVLVELEISISVQKPKKKPDFPPPKFLEKKKIRISPHFTYFWLHCHILSTCPSSFCWGSQHFPQTLWFRWLWKHFSCRRLWVWAVGGLLSLWQEMPSSSLSSSLQASPSYLQNQWLHVMVVKTRNMARIAFYNLIIVSLNKYNKTSKLLVSADCYSLSAKSYELILATVLVTSLCLIVSWI